ncbi:hypothetical protein SH591_03175 [Sphingomonas sp. LY54]|uniref:hypothetical protein n=1 Tax=Sphingomonas sp. LY54 TaxID=3095343 RepID=UPI002D7A05EB|nr:hypothetical protein [Sphingomonas sp. LY54]WRP29201.1 hypothetical protein SH591_03175 [Sphingomonas sp. LY54]
MLRPFLLLALAMLPGTAHATWKEASSKHFVIYSEEGADSLRDFATRLERYDSAMRKLRGLADHDPGPANRLTVYVVSDVNRVRRLAGGDRFVAGFYMPRASNSIAIIPRRLGAGSRYDLDPEIVLLHEYAHHFLFENYAAAYPIWFSEGFAEVHSTTRFEKDGSLGIGLPPVHRAYELADKTSFPLKEMLAHGTGKLTTDQRSAIYSRGWLLTHYLIFEPTRKGQLNTFLKELNAGRSPLDAATLAFGDLDTLGRDIDRYLRRRKMSFMKVAASALNPGAVTIRELSAGEDALMDLKIRSRRGVTREQALELVPEIRRLAAGYANDPAAQATLAEAEYDAGNFREAEAAADRALAVDPKAIDALIYKGRARMALAGDSSDEAAWKDVRRWFLAANKIDADDPEPLMLFYHSFAAAGARPTANAVAGLLQAHALAPQDRSLRMVVARQHLQDGRVAETRKTLAPIAYDPHAGRAGQVAANIIEILDKSDSAAALAAWNKAATEAEDDNKADDKES